MKPSLRILLSALAALGVAVSFQNCGAPSASQASGGSESGSSEFALPVANYKQVIFDPQLEMQAANKAVGANGRVELNIESGDLKLTLNGVEKICTLDSERQAQLAELLTNAQVCEPAQPAPGTVVCLAIGAADIELVNSEKRVQLRPVICQSGRYLCDGKDAELRAILLSLKSQPPANCN
jgi:hypothetical protein